MPIFSRPNVDLWYRVVKSEPHLENESVGSFSKSSKIPVLGIMGLAAHGDYWSPFIVDQVSKQRPMVVFDNRGCGRSSGDCEGLKISTMADDALLLMDHLEIEKAHVFGISMGGMITLSLALRAPSRIQSLTIGCSTARPKRFNFNPQVVSPIIDSLRKGGAVAPILFSQKFIKEHPDEVRDFEARIASQKVSKNVVWEQIKASWSFDVLDRISQIGASTLIMSGDRDLIIPHECSEELARGIPGSRIHLFEGSGHAFVLENQTRVLEMILNHWNTSDPKGV